MLTSKIELSGSLKADLEFFIEQCAKRLIALKDIVREYRYFCRINHLRSSHLAIEMLEHLLASVDMKIAQAKNMILKNKTDYCDLIEVESVVRALMQAIASGYQLLSWRSASYTQSVAPQFFHLSAQNSPDVNYERYGCVEVLRIEQQMLEVMRLPETDFSCTIVNSGMAAYSLVEAYLMRDILQNNDAVVSSPYIYFEASQQLKNLKHVRHYTAKAYSAKALIELVEKKNAKVLFADPLANTLEQRLIDIKVLLNNFNQKKDSPVIIIDGVMLPCVSSEFIAAFANKNKLFYIESCSKYLQFGLDMSMAGFVIHAKSLKSRFDILRRNMGLAITEASALLFPFYTHHRFMNRVKRMEYWAKELAMSLAEHKIVRRCLTVIHPSLPKHPDAKLSMQIRRSGTCITFKPRLLNNNNEAQYQKQLSFFINFLIAQAQAQGIPLTKGVSFGFSFSRISAASAMAENTAPFLRLSVGDHGARINRALVDIFAVTCEKMLVISKESADLAVS